MDENLHDIDKLFRDPIEEHEEMPAAKVWDAIESNLDKSNIVSIKKKYNNLKKLAAVLLLLLLGTIAYEIQTKKPGGKNVAVNDKQQSAAGSSAKEKTAPVNQTIVTTTPGGASDTAIAAAGNNYTTSNAIKGANDSIADLPVTPAANNAASGATRQEQSSNVASNAPSVNKPKKKMGIPVSHTAGAAGSNTNTTSLSAGRQKKSSSGQKTKITVHHNETEEEVVVDKQDAVPASYKNERVATSHYLTALLQEPAELLHNGYWNKQPSAQLYPAAVLPEADIKNRIAKSMRTKTTRPFHFSITPFVSPQFSFNRLEDDHYDPGPGPRPVNGREKIKEEEQRQASTALGLLIDIPVGKNWGLQSGVSYTSRKTEIEPKKIFAKMDTDGKVKYRFDCASGYTYISPKAGAAPVVGDSVTAAASTNTLQYITVPLAVNYSFSLGKFNIVPAAGVMINFLAKQQIQTEIIQGAVKEAQTINTIQGMKSAYFNAFTGVAVEYNFSKKAALSLMPLGNFALSSINKDAAVKSYPNSFGLSAGIKVKF